MNQKTFSRLWDGYETDQAAKSARDAFWREQRAAGKRATRSVLKNQLKKYDGLGQPNGSSCDVYMVTVFN